jgi:hypothetical protein
MCSIDNEHETPRSEKTVISPDQGFLAVGLASFHFWLFDSWFLGECDDLWSERGRDHFIEGQNLRLLILASWSEVV